MAPAVNDAAMTLVDSAAPSYDALIADNDGSSSDDMTSKAGITLPTAAASVGFTNLVLNSGGDAGWNIDTNQTGNPGYDWYLAGFDGIAGKPGDYSVSQGVLTVNNAVTGFNGNYTLGTAQHASNTNGYVGTVYGGGYYAEASIAIDSKCTWNGYSGGWPAFWGEPVEHFAHGGTADHWPNQVANYEHFVELDFMEYWMNGSGVCKNMSCYTFANLDWYGVYGTATSTCNQTGYCNVANDGSKGVLENNVAKLVPANTDWQDFNVYGALVVPSSLNKGTGYTQAYFNNTKATSQPNSWATYDPNAAPPPSGTQVFAITDIQHYIIILGASPACPMQVNYVRVWQAP